MEVAAESRAVEGTLAFLEQHGNVLGNRLTFLTLRLAFPRRLDRLSGR
jgi:hypothetical protein